jgi:hypothetical protein
MPFTSFGYDGTVNEANWAKMQRILGSTYAVDGATDFATSIKTGVDRTVTVAAGVAGGHGVFDTQSVATDVAIPSVSSGTRFDLIALHRDWGTNTTSIVRIEGGSQELTLPVRDNEPGVEDDQPIALVGVTAGSTAITVVRDLRVWPGYYAVHELALQYLAEVGAQVRIGNRQYLFRLNANATAGEWYWTSVQKVLGQAATPTYEDGLVWIETVS